MPKTVPKETTWLKRITLENYRCFRKLRVDFDRRLTVLVANNGMGKTAVLDAAAISLSAFVGAFHIGKRIGIAEDDVRLKVKHEGTLQMEPLYPCVLECEGVVNGIDVCWQRRKNTAKSNNTHKEAKSIIEVGEDLQKRVSDDGKEIGLPLIAYYGTGRLWSQKKFTEKKSFKSAFFSRTAGYLDCLEPSSSYKYFVDWFRHASRADNSIRDSKAISYGRSGLDGKADYGSLLDAVSQAVNICLKHTKWKNLHFSSIHEAPVVEHAAYGVLKVSRLSDGIRNMIAMVADIASRAARLNPHLGSDAAMKSPGIVLIDEVDMHLHPEWQQSIARQLGEAFPGMQFIVTTHSPQVLSTVRSENIRHLGLNQDGADMAVIPLGESYARASNDVLQAVMHVNPYPKFDGQGTLEKYRKLVEQGDFNRPGIIEEIDALKSDLENILGDNHPEMMKLEVVRTRREALE